MLQLVNVFKTYRLRNALPVKALDDVSVTFQETGMVFILGKSGSGKSTMLNVIGGLDKADQGEIIIKGKSSRDFKEGDFDSYRNTFIGFVFQEYNLLEDFSIGKNIALALELQGRVATKEAINDILTQVDMQGYEHRRVNQISGGQKQRVAIARALIKSPQIILADEPTGALDSVTGRQVFEILQKLSKDKLVIVVSHDRETAERYGDRIIEMKDGQILSDTSKVIKPPVEINRGIKVNKNVIHVADDYHFTPTDLKLIDQMKADNDTVILTKNEKLVTSYNFEHTDPSRLDTKAYDGNLLKFIVSKLKNVDSLKIGASSLKHKRVRLFFTILLSFVSIAFFALTDTMSAFQSDDAHARTLADNNVKTVELYQIYKTDENSLFGGMTTNVNFSEQHIENLREAFPDAGIAPIREEDLFLAFDSTTIGNLSVGNQVLYSTLYNLRKQTIYMSDDYLTTNNIDVLAGTYPTNSEDYMISSFALELFRRFSFPYYDDGDPIAKYILPSGFTANEVSNASLVLGKNIKSGTTSKISGVYHVDYDEALFTEEHLQLLIGNYQEQEKINTHINDNRLFALLQDDQVLNDLHYSNEGISDRYYPGNANIGVSYDGGQTYYPGITLNYVIKEEDLRPAQLIKFDNTPLADDQIILSYHTFVERYDEVSYFTMDTYDGSNHLILKFNAGETTYEFSSVNDFVTWSQTPSHMTLLRNRFVDDYGLVKINNANKGYSNMEDYEIAGIYFPTDLYETVGANTTYYFKHWFDKTFTVNDTKLADFPLSLISRVLFTNNSSDLYSTYSALIRYKEGSYTLMFQSPFSMTFAIFGTLIQGFTIVFLVLGIILAVFSALLMMNFIATSISYKKRDIGILRGLGARKLDVVKIFTYESLVIAAINIVLAIVVTIPSVALINNVAIEQIGMNVTLLAFTFRQLLLVIGVAVLSALLASILPVLNIARKKPIDAINNR